MTCSECWDIAAAGGPTECMLCASSSAADISHDLRELTPLECEELNLKHSSEDFHYTAFDDTETDQQRIRAFCAAVNRAFARRVGA